MMVDHMEYRHKHSPGFLFGLIDFCTAGLFFLVYIPASGLHRELESILGHRIQPYWQAYLLGIPTMFIYTLVWTANVCKELGEKALELGIEGKHTSWKHMFWWNMLGCFCFGPMIATHRMFGTLGKIEKQLDKNN